MPLYPCRGKILQPWTNRRLHAGRRVQLGDLFFAESRGFRSRVFCGLRILCILCSVVTANCGCAGRALAVCCRVRRIVAADRFPAYNRCVHRIIPTHIRRNRLLPGLRIKPGQHHFGCLHRCEHRVIWLRIRNRNLIIIRSIVRRINHRADRIQ